MIRTTEAVLAHTDAVLRQDGPAPAEVRFAACRAVECLRDMLLVVRRRGLRLGSPTTRSGPRSTCMQAAGDRPVSAHPTRPGPPDGGMREKGSSGSGRAQAAVVPGAHAAFALEGGA